MTDRIQLPEKKYLGIKEVSEICNVSQNVLRAWETKFDCLKDVQRRNNRRYYTHENVRDIARIRDLTQEQGFTLDGANQYMKTGATELPAPEKTTVAPEIPLELISELESIRSSLKT